MEVRNGGGHILTCLLLHLLGFSFGVKLLNQNLAALAPKLAGMAPCSPSVLRKWMLTVIYWMEHRAPNEGARKSTQGAKGVYHLTSTPRACVSSCLCSRRWPSQPSLGREAPWSCTLYMPQHRGTAGLRSGSGWAGKRDGRGQGIGDFRDNI